MQKYSKIRNRDNYVEEKLSLKSESSRNIFRVAIKSLDALCKSKFNVENFDVVLSDILKLDTEEMEDNVISLLQTWVNQLSKKKSFNTIKIEFSAINKYLKYHKIRLDFSDEIEFPQQVHEERYAISLDEIRKILDISKFKQKCYYLCLISSGSRPVEVLGLRKMDFFWTGKRYGAKIPAHLTKKKQSRTTFFSRECNVYLSSLLKKFEDSQTIFTKNPILKNARTSEDSVLKKKLKKLGIHYQFETTGYSKINLYCFRAYFFTKAIRAFNEDVAHSMIGHGAYLQQYQRRTDREKEELYEELESQLLVNDLEQKNSEIKKLRQLNEELLDKEDRLKMVEKKLNVFESFLHSSTQPELVKFIEKMRLHSH